MNILKVVITLTLLLEAYELYGKKRACAQTKPACAIEESCSEPKYVALRPRTRRNQCPPPEYGLNCDSCCYQAYTTPSYYGNAFRPYSGDGYFGRRPGNYNFSF